MRKISGQIIKKWGDNNKEEQRNLGILYGIKNILT